MALILNNGTSSHRLINIEKLEDGVKDIPRSESEPIPYTSLSHVTLHCQHPTIHALICGRHDETVHRYVTDVTNGEYGGYLIRSDYGKPNPEPRMRGERWTIHPSLIPENATTNFPHIPDIVIYNEHCRTDPVPSTTQHKLIIFDETYTTNTNREKANMTKQSTYESLMSLLQSQGHSAALHIITSDIRAPLLKHDIKTLHEIGVLPECTKQLQYDVWKCAVQYMHKIILAWRQLESATIIQQPPLNHTGGRTHVYYYHKQWGRRSLSPTYATARPQHIVPPWAATPETEKPDRVSSPPPIEPPPTGKARKRHRIDTLHLGVN